MSSTVVTDGIVSVEQETRPYPPSWVDRLTDRVRHLPVPAWLVYATLGLASVLAFTAIK
ncbi:MAG: hypothetical protein M3328_06425 [Chloroflexota bacterium]|nr:hypothetical protein [Chloroflexota bacterium]